MGYRAPPIEIAKRSESRLMQVDELHRTAQRIRRRRRVGMAICGALVALCGLLGLLTGSPVFIVLYFVVAAVSAAYVRRGIDDDSDTERWEQRARDLERTAQELYQGDNGEPGTVKRRQGLKA